MNPSQVSDRVGIILLAGCVGGFALGLLAGYSRRVSVPVPWLTLAVPVACIAIFVLTSDMLGRMTMIKLDVGCGLNLKQPLDEWTHLDCDEGPHIELVTDFADIPLEDGSVEEIWIGDVIEHIPVWRQAEVLQEWHRVLKPDGVLNGTTPNLHRKAMQYARGEIDLGWFLQNLYGDRRGPPHQHYILFTPESLESLLDQHGFGHFDCSRSIQTPDGPEWIHFICRRLHG